MLLESFLGIFGFSIVICLSGQSHLKLVLHLLTLSRVQLRWLDTQGALSSLTLTTDFGSGCAFDLSRLLALGERISDILLCNFIVLFLLLLLFSFLLVNLHLIKLAFFSLNQLSNLCVQFLQLFNVVLIIFLIAGAIVMFDSSLLNNSLRQN